MPEPITAPQEQVPPGTPQQVQQEAVPTGNQPVQQTQTGDEPTPEQIAQWRASADQAAQFQQQLQQRDEQFRNLQADYTRKAQALAQLAGATPPQAPADPIAQYAKALESKGYNATQARDLAEMNYSMMQQEVAPLRQKLSAFETAQAIEPQIKGSLDALYGRSPQLFTNPGTYEKAMLDVRNAVQAGMRVDDKFVEQMTVLAAHELGQSRPQQVVPMQPAPQIFANGMNRPTTGYPPPAQPARQAVPLEFQQGSDFVKEYLKLPNAS